jgi:hypothetical protein
MSDQQPPALSRTRLRLPAPPRRPAPPRSTPRSTGRSDTTTCSPSTPGPLRSSRSSEQAKQWYDLLVTSEDPDTRRQAAEALGYELPEDEQPEEEFEPAEYDDPVEELRARQQALEERSTRSSRGQRMAYEGALIREIVDDALGPWTRIFRRGPGSGPRVRHQRSPRCPASPGSRPAAGLAQAHRGMAGASDRGAEAVGEDQARPGRHARRGHRRSRCPTQHPRRPVLAMQRLHDAQTRSRGCGRGRQQGDPQMAQSALTMAAVIKDIWTDDQLQKQFEDKNSPLPAWRRCAGTMIGTQAQVPIFPGRAGSYTSVGAAGGALNPATGSAGQPGAVHDAVLVVPDRARDVGAGADRQQRAERHRGEGPGDPGRRREHPPSDQPSDRHER